MSFDRFARALPALATAVALSACVAVGPVASPTLLPTIAPTPSLSPTSLITPTPTAAPTASPTAPPTTPPTAPPTTPPTAPPTTPPTTPPTAPPAGQLDFTAAPNYGILEIDSGFVPDPRTQDVTSGGPVDVSYLGGICKGFATSQPDYSVRYTVGTPSSLLRIYFEGSGDTTLVINDPAGNWVCNDDYATGNLNPSIDFTDPSGGRYDIWVGSFAQNTPVLGTLSVTELSSNHP